MNAEHELTEEQIEAIRQQAEETYLEVAAERGKDPDQVHYNGQCSFISRSLAQRLRRIGIETERINAVSARLGAHHTRLETHHWVIDGGWQFFLPAPDPTLPKVLIVRKDQLAETLNTHGITGFDHYYWLARESDPLIDDLGISGRELTMSMQHSS